MECDTNLVVISEFDFIPPCGFLDNALNAAMADAQERYGKRLMSFKIHYYPPAPFGYAAMIEWILCDAREDDASS